MHWINCVLTPSLKPTHKLRWKWKSWIASTFDFFARHNSKLKPRLTTAVGNFCGNGINRGGAAAVQHGSTTGRAGECCVSSLNVVASKTRNSILNVSNTTLFIVPFGASFELDRYCATQSSSRGFKQTLCQFRDNPGVTNLCIRWPFSIRVQQQQQQQQCWNHWEHKF